jgi:hypothetical protein
MMGFFDFFFRNKINDGIAENDAGDVLQPGSSKVRSFNEEFSTELYDTQLAQPYDSYLNNGVQFQEVSRALRVSYNGLLAKSGAQDVYAIVGYGNNLKWEDVEYYPLQKVGHQTFELILPVKRDGNINMAFKDGANNWDNNSGMNYSFSNHFFEGSY